MTLEIVAAVAANGVIGRGGTLPWHLPDDLRHFKTLTMGHPILMGRRTFESLGRALPGRRSIVVSTTLAQAPAGVEIARSLDDATRLIDSTGPAFIIGGAKLYAEAMSRASKMQLTELDEPVEGDVTFPTWDRSQWRLIAQTRHERDDRHAIAFSFNVYQRLA